MAVSIRNHHLHHPRSVEKEVSRKTLNFYRQTDVLAVTTQPNTYVT